MRTPAEFYDRQLRADNERLYAENMRLRAVADAAEVMDGAYPAITRIASPTDEEWAAFHRTADGLHRALAALHADKEGE